MAGRQRIVERGRDRTRRGRTVAITAALVAFAGGVAAPAQATSGPLEPLRDWGSATAASVGSGGPSDRGVTRRLARLDALVPAVARNLRTASATTRSREIAVTRTALAAALDPLADRLDTPAGRALLLGYQGRLERLAERAGLDRAPTGRALRTAAAVADADGDGVADDATGDADGDGLPDAVDASDLGWGIPDGLRVRPPAGAPSAFCVYLTEAVPVVRTVADGERWARRAARRGCATPRALRAFAGFGLLSSRVSASAAAADDGVAFRVTGATMTGRRVVARITVPAAARADVEVVQQGVASGAPGAQAGRTEILRRRGLRIARGTSSLDVTLDRPLVPGPARLIVVARHAGDAPASVRSWCRRIAAFERRPRGGAAREADRSRRRLVREAGWDCDEIRTSIPAPSGVRSWCRRIAAYERSRRRTASARKAYEGRRKLVAERGWRCTRRGPRPREMRTTVPLTVLAEAPAAAQGTAVPPPVPAPAPVAPLPPPPAPSDPCADSRDTDGDGISDCLETKGFDLVVYEPGAVCAGSTRQFACRRSSTRRVTSDPRKVNTDDDAVRLEDGRVFELTDGEEWAFHLAGGLSDPSRGDTDEDGIGDVEEIKRWGSAPNTSDTDGDSAENVESSVPPNPQLFDGAEIRGGVNGAERPATSPTALDTDGDGETDLEEVEDGTVNPAIAEVPEFDVAPDPAAPGVNLSLRVEEGETITLETVTTEEETTRREDERTVRYLQQHRVEVNGEVTLKGKLNIGGGGGAGDGGSGGNGGDGGSGGGAGLGGSVGLEGKIGVTYEYLTSKERTHTRRFTQESKRGSQTTYSETFSKSTAPEGTLSASFVVRNTNPFTSIQLKNLRVFASFICLPRPDEVGCLNPDQTTVIPSPLIPDPQAFPDGIVLPAGSSRRITLRADDVNASILKSIAANPTSLAFQPADADLFLPGAEEPLAATIGRSVPRSTAKLTVDDGNGQVRSVLVAAGQGRDWGAPSAFQAPPIPITDALDVAGLEYETFRQPGDDGTPGEGEEVLRTILGRSAQPARADFKVNGAWVIFGDSTPGASGDFSDIVLPIGSDTHVSYVRDQDADGIFDREELMVGSSDTNADSDGDGATRACDDPALPADAEACPDGHQETYPSDLFELRVGWNVPVRRGPNEGYDIFSDPASCDGDRDGSPDGPLGCPIAQLPAGTPHELGRRTDPALRDTDGDGIIDSEDPQPTFRPPRLVSGTFEAEDLVATGGPVVDAPGVRVLAEPGSRVRTPSFTLCAAPGLDECQAATGFYRATIELSREGVEDAGVASKGTMRITSAPSTPFAPHDTLLEASLDLAEMPVEGQVVSKDLYFAIGSEDVEDVVVSLVRTGTSDLAVRRILLTRIGVPGATTNLAQFLAAGRDPANDQRFAAIAFPGRFLAMSEEQPRVGNQSIALLSTEAPVVQSFGPGFALSPRLGVATAKLGLSVRRRGTGDAQVVTFAATAGDRPANPTSEVVHTDSDNPHSYGLVDPQPSRRPLTMGRVYHGDFADTYATTYFNFPFDVRSTTENISFPVVAMPGTPDGDVQVDNVVIDRVGRPLDDPAAAPPAARAGEIDAVVGLAADNGALQRRGTTWNGAGLLPRAPYFVTGGTPVDGDGIRLDSHTGNVTGSTPSARAVVMPDGINVPVHPEHHQWSWLNEVDRTDLKCQVGGDSFAIMFEEDRSTEIAWGNYTSSFGGSDTGVEATPFFRGIPLDHRHRIYIHNQESIRAGLFIPQFFGLKDRNTGYDDNVDYATQPPNSNFPVPPPQPSAHPSHGGDITAARVFRMPCAYGDGSSENGNGPRPIVRRLYLQTRLSSPVRSSPR